MKGLYGLLLAGLLAILALEWHRYAAAPAAAPPSPSGDQPPRPAAPATPAFTIQLRPQAAYELIGQRPLFSASRRPDAPQDTAAEPTQTQALDGLALSAVLIAGAEHKVLIKDPKTQETLRLAQGDKVRGWTIERIQPASVQLALGARTAQLELRVFAPPPAATPAHGRHHAPRAARRRRPPMRRPHLHGP
jgi:hypothetical protein